MLLPLSVKRSGYASIISVLLVGGAALGIALTITALHIGSLRYSRTLIVLHQAQAMADACAEAALQHIHDHNNYVGTMNLVIGSNGCSYTIVNTGGQQRTVTATATVQQSTRRSMLMITQITPTITVTWKEQ